MSTCCWCTPGGISAVEFLRRYAFRTRASEFRTADDDLCYCLECVIEYHRARDELPFLHEVLWELETLRLVKHFEKCMKGEIDDAEDELYIIDNNGEAQPFDFTGQDFENKLRVPLLEILKYPYLLLHEHVNELCVEALCRMEQANCSFQVFEKQPGIYLFLVHPNEMVRRWAILTARGLGKVDRDDYYDLQEVLTCLFKVIELGLLENPDIYATSVLEKGKLIILPPHMYDASNYKNYWLGICMLLTILEEQAMDSLLLGSDKQNDFMQSILTTMKKQTEGTEPHVPGGSCTGLSSQYGHKHARRTGPALAALLRESRKWVCAMCADDSEDPFWPALHCFMVILDRLGSKVWGQLIDPIEAFQTIIENASYNKEIQNIRRSSVRAKPEPESCLDDMVTCSQIVYNYNPEKTKKDSGWRSAICPDYCPNMYEEMETLTSVLQSDIGQDMRVHNSTFLWFIPFVQSLMDLNDLGMAYIVEVIHHLYSQVKDVLNQKAVVCDKVTEFFLLILVSVVELHRSKKCLHLLWVSSQQWVDALVKCAKLPTTAFARNSEKSSASSSKGAVMITSLSLHSVPSNSVQLACVQLIRSLLKEGYQLGQQALCKQFWDKLNLFLRGNLSLGWQLDSRETQDLQTCLKQIIRNIRLKMPQYTALAEPAPPWKTSRDSNGKEESEQVGKACEKDIPCLESGSPVCSKEPLKADVCQEQESSVVSKTSDTIEEKVNEQNCIKDLKLEDHLSAESHLKQSSKNLSNARTQDQVKRHTRKQKSVRNKSCAPQNCPSRNDPEGGCDGGVTMSAHLLTDSNTDSLDKAPTSKEDFSLKNDVGKTSKAKTKAQKSEICAKLAHVIKKQNRKSALVKNTVDLKGDVTVSDPENFCSRIDPAGQNGGSFIQNSSLDLNDSLDHKNEKMKSPNSLLLKQLKKEKLDVPSAHENDCQIQECHVNNKVFNSFTLMPKASSCKNPVILLGSKDKEINKSTDRVSSDLREQAPSSPQCDILTDSQIDRDLHKLSLIAQASVSNFPSDSTQKSSSQLQRKVKDKRSFRANQNHVREICKEQVIIISDDDDDEQILDFEKHTKQDKMCLEKEWPRQDTSIVNMNVDMKPTKEEKTEEFEDSGSQLFEFESQQKVFSVWQDQKPDKGNSVQEDEKNPCLTYIADITNDWGYDTDYPMFEDVTKNEAEGTEHAKPQSGSSFEEVCEIQVKKHKRKLKNTKAEDSLRPSSSVRNKDQSDTLHESDRTENDTKIADIRTSPESGVERATRVSLKKSPRKHRTYSKVDRRASVSKTPKKTHSDTKKGQNKGSHYISCRSTPAIMLPKKSRHCPEPTSVAEKLGLKKAPRRAFELSQRSLDIIDKLRHHGKTVGEIGTPKKTKLISPQSLPANDKKLLVSQDLQFQRKRRSKSHRNRQGLYDSTDTTRAGPHAAQNSDSVRPDTDRADDSNKGGTEVGSYMANGSGNQSIKCVSPEQGPGKEKYVSQVAGDACLLSPCSSPVLNGRIPTSEITVCTLADPLGGGNLTGHHLGVPTWKRGQLDSNGDMEGDDIFLTQHDPEDMDLGSQMQNGDDGLTEEVHQKSVHVEDSINGPPSESLSSARCKNKDCVETVKSQGEYCSKHSEAKAADEDVFRKPALPLSMSKPLRPSTTKIFSSSSTSRIANFSKSLESASTLSGPKNKSNGRQPASKVPQPASLSSPKPRVELSSLCNILNNSPTPSNSSRQAFKLAFAESRPFSSSPINMLLSSQSISDTFVKEVLKWKYEMFMKFDQCGPPASLCQAISRHVPIRFQDCGDYFEVFFPLLLLNAFETVAQEWINSPNKGKFYELKLRKFPAEYKKYWEFVVFLEEYELSKQLHPKENDLVFLVPERPKGEKRDVERNSIPASWDYQCAYVQKFRRSSVMHKGKYECSLSIQTQDSFPARMNDTVKCVVVSSLVTTQRKLKAMSLLNSRNQLARAILNPNPMDFCTKDLLTTSSERITAFLKDFNEDQKKAIETAYAMVRHSPAVAKICLIHGPPGTGKSRTIVGLLYRLLTERGQLDENSNAKIKQNRVLVCAPSNGAVDELMKKIILEFKERCKDKKNPLGNCGDINLVRLGPERSINSEVLKFSLDNQVNHRMKKDLPSYVQEMHRRKEHLDHQLDELSRQRALSRYGRGIQRHELDEKIAQVSKERQELASKIKEVQGRPQKTQSIIILESHIICCTLSTSGGLLLESAFRGQGGVPFSCVIVDEAGQACEVETLTPLIHRCNKLILVGDPKQLPPTVISLGKLSEWLEKENHHLSLQVSNSSPFLTAQEFGYEQSMMARFCKLLEENVEHHVSARLPVLQLTVQYRMHPDICLFPSNYIYNKSLKTNRGTESTRCLSKWPFQPYLVFDVRDGSERRENDSYVNLQEIKVVIELVKLLKDKRDVRCRTIGIITHYKAQKVMIQKELDKQFEEKGLAEVDTVDAFQGRQKDCVIVTCVRANAMQGSIGFLASLQRLNVAITRAKYSLFILGHLRTLMDNHHWNHLIQDAQRRGAIIRTSDQSYKHDVTKTLKLKSVLQRSLTYPSSTAPEGSSPQDSSPDNAPNPAPLDPREAAVSAAGKDPERPPAKDQPRDPRLFRRMEASANSLRSLEPWSPQQPGAASPAPSAEPSFPHGPGDPPAASVDSTSKSDQKGGQSRQRESRASRDRDQGIPSPGGHRPKRSSSWDAGRTQADDSGWKRRRL